MLKRFLITLCFSWLANPLGVLIAHALGVTDRPTLVMVLLATSTCAPFQVFLNESLAASRAAGHGVRLERVLLPLVVAQCLACAAALLAGRLPLAPGAIVAVVAATAATSVASFWCTVRFYEFTLAGAFSLTRSALFGALPGLVAMALYVAASVAGGLSVFLEDAILVSVALVPTLVVWSWIASLPRPEPPEEAARDDHGQSRHFFRILITVVAGLMVLTFVGTVLRERISAFRPDLAALIIVVLNSMASLLTTVTRVLFFRRAAPVPPATIPLVATGVAAIGAPVSWWGAEAVGLILLLAGVQGLVVALIEVGRRAGGGAPTRVAVGTSA